MNAHDWARLKLWFGEAMEADAQERALLLARVRAEAPQLAPELDSLLTSHDGPGPSTTAIAPKPGFTHERFPEGVPAGTEIGRYRAVSELGRGGSGLVLHAERSDDEFHRPVALKLLRFGSAGDEANRLRLERGSLARMQHANIATLHDWGTTDDGIAWLATEFVQGEPIDAYCHARRLGPDAVIALFLQVGAAVAYAHERAVYHRDLKPGNIFVRRDGVVKLLDFGIAQFTGADEAPPGRASFTPAYASPEQLQGATATAAGDVYSLGVVLGELLAGVMPPDLHRLPHPLAAIVAHAVASDPACRYPSVAAFMADLERYRRHLPPLGVASPWRRHAWLFCRRHPRSLVASAAVAACVSLAAWVLFSRAPNRRPGPAITFAAQALGQHSDPLPLRISWTRGAHVHDVQVLTQGVPDLDFASPDTAACIGDFAPGSSCTVHVRFTPTLEGAVFGAVVFRDAGGRALATRFLTGGGAQAHVWSADPVPVRTLSGFNYPRGLSTDGAGNAYFVEAFGSTVDEIPAGQDRARVLVRLSRSLRGGGTAVDGAGHVYFSSTADHAIFRLDSGTSARVASFPADVLLDNSLTVDGAGNLYTSDMNGAIYIADPDSDRITTLFPGAHGHRFVSLASDADGNLFLPDYISSSLFELPLGGSDLLTLVAPDGHLHQPHAIAILPANYFLVGNDRNGARVLDYGVTGSGSQLVTWPVGGSLSLALFGQSRLFAVVDNRSIAIYRLFPLPL